MDTGARENNLMITDACRSSSMGTGARKNSLMITDACRSIIL